MIKKLLKTTLFFFVGAIAPHAVALPQILTFATQATYPPFESINQTGAMQGFDVDIVNAVCQQMNVKCTLVNQPWESLIPSLKLGKFDALIGAMNITEERKKQVDFTDAYYKNTASFVASADKKLNPSPAGLKDKTVGVQGGTTQQYFLEGEYPQTKVKTYANEQDTFLDLVSGRVDAVLGDTPVVMIWMKENNSAHKYIILGQPIANPKYFNEGYGIAVKKGNAELLAALNKALAEIKKNGQYQKIMQKYF